MRVPALSNTDGDPLSLTVDRFHFDPDDLDRIESKLRRMKDVIPPEDSEDKIYTFSRPEKPGGLLPSTTIGEVRFDGPESLAAQIRLDCDDARAALG